MQPSSPLNGNDNAGNNWNGKKIITEYKYGNTWVSTMAINPGSLRTPGGGLLSVYPSGPFDYQPLPSFHGVDKFAYRGANGVGVNGLNWEDVNIEVGAQPPGCGCGDTNRVSYSSGLPVNWPPAGSETSAALSLTLFLVNDANGRGEQPSFGQSVIPVYGSIRNASYNYAQGNYGTYVFYCIMTGTDVFLVRSLATSGARLIGRGLPAFGAGAVSRGGLNSTVTSAPAAAQELVAQAEQMYPKLAGRCQWRRTWPFEFGPPPDIYWTNWSNTLRLPAAYHQLITNELRTGLRAFGANPSGSQLWELLQSVYTRYPINGFPARGAGLW